MKKKKQINVIKNMKVKSSNKRNNQYKKNGFCYAQTLNNNSNDPCNIFNNENECLNDTTDTDYWNSYNCRWNKYN